MNYNNELILLKKITTDINIKLKSNNYKYSDNYTNYIINIFDNKYFINNINEYQIFINNINILFYGYYEIFKNTFITGKILFNKLIKKNNDINNDNKYINVYVNDLDQIDIIKEILYKFYKGYVDNYIIYIINDLEIHIHKNKIINIFELLLNDDNNTQNNFCLYQNNLYTNPLTYYILFKCSDLIIPFIDINIKNIIYEILNNNFVFDNQNKNHANNLNLIIKIAFYLNRIKLIKTLLKLINKDFFTIDNNYKIIFNAIDNKNIDVLNLILNHTYIENKIEYKFNLNILNNDGFNPAEYTIILRTQIDKNDDKNINIYANISNIISHFNFNRHPKWIDLIYNMDIYKHNINDIIEQKINENICNLKFIKNTFILNNLILDSMYSTEELNLNNIIEYITFNIKYFNKKMLLDTIKHHGSTGVIRHLINEKIINIDKEVLIILFQMNLYDFIINFKEQIIDNINYILINLINTYNFKGLIFLIEYIDKNICNMIIDNNNNTIFHLLCNNTINNEIEYEKMYNIYKIIFKNQNIINNVNDKNETCIFNIIKSKNYYLMELLLVNNIDLNIKNNNGNYLIHEIINFNNNEMLELLLKYNKNLLNVINDNEDTPILFACKNKNIEIINTLASYKCDLSKVDKFENSIYHYISLYKLKTNIKSLNCKNKFNNTTLDYLLCNIWINVNK
jgi:hypothetical protein